MVCNEHFLLIAIFVKSKSENMVNWEKLNRNYVKSPIISTLYYFNFIDAVVCWTFIAKKTNRKCLHRAVYFAESIAVDSVTRYTNLTSYIHQRQHQLFEGRKKYNMILYIICVCVTCLRIEYMPHRVWRLKSHVTQTECYSKQTPFIYSAAPGTHIVKLIHAHQM